MKCEQVQERLSEYLEGRLDPENHMAVRDHLSSCSRCQAEAEALDQTIRSVSNLHSLEPPLGFSQKVMARIREEAQKPSLWRRLFLPMRIKIPIHALALLLVGGIAVYLYHVNRQAGLPLPTKMAESIPSKSEPMPRQELKAPAAPPPPSALLGQRPKEVDEVTTGTPGRDRELKREGIASPEPLAKRKMSDLKSSTAPMAPGPQPIQAAQYELTFTPKEPLEGMKALAPKLEVLVKQVGGEYLQPVERGDSLKRNLLLEPQTVWLAIPEDHYGQFKAELSSLGEIESESHPSGLVPQNSAEAPSPLRIQLIILLPQNPEKALPTDQPVR